MWAGLFSVAHAKPVETAQTPSTLRVLYVGWDPKTVQLDINDMDVSEDPLLAARLLALKKSRSPDFEQFLRQYFSTVKVVYAPAYREAMSGDYDVTIFDALPKPVRAGVSRRDSPRDEYEPPQYLSAEFDRAALLINTVSPNIASPLRYKMDWKCLCLGKEALGMRLEHPIFNAPYEVKPTLKYIPTPANFFEHYNGRALAATMPAWLVQRDAYDDNGYPSGMVSSGQGFANAPDAEVIAGGVSSMSVDAVSLARHGNFFHWGFSAGPQDMTEEGRLVFINAVHYIARFNGQRPYSRRRYPYPANREDMLDLAYGLFKGSYEEWAEERKESHEKRQAALKDAQATGKKLSAEDLEELGEPVLPLSREGWLKEQLMEHAQEVVALLGADLKAYLPYYEANLEYLRPAQTAGDWVNYLVDEDVRSLAVSNRSPELLETCVLLLEHNLDAAKAQRLLERYTDQKLKAAEEWRAWLDRNRERLYFSDEDDFRFHVAPKD